MSVTSASTYFITSEGNVYYKLNRDTFYNELQGLFGTSIGALATLSDVDVTGLVAGSLLRYNGSQWVDTAVADYFQNGGNAGGAARTLGNTDNYNLGFKTNNIERLRILDTGEVGIGSTTDSDIDDAQLFIRTAKTKAAILYNYAVAGTSVLSFQVNNSASARKETFLIDAYFADDTASSEVGLVDFNIKKNGSFSPQTIISFAGLYDDGVNPQADSLTTYMTSALHIVLDDLDGIAAADYRVLKVSGSTGAFDFRANGDTYLTGAMVIGSTSLSASAAFEVVSTTKGLRLPNMTEVQRDAISSPVAGLLIYNTTTSAVNLYNGAWVAI